MTEKVQRAITEYTKESLEGAGKEVVQVSIRVTRPKAKLPPSAFIVQAMSLLVSKRLSNCECRVLFFLLAKSEFQNYVGVDIACIGETLQVTRRTVISAINTLIDEGVLVRVPNPLDARRSDYFINPVVAWRGNSLERAKKISALALIEGGSNLLGLTMSEQIKKERKR